MALRAIFLILLLMQQAVAAPDKLPLPRFASLRSNKVNLHVGPGSGSPTEWTFQRQGLPIEIIAEFDTWRQIRYLDGTVGWVHKSLLAGKRTAVVINKQAPLKSDPTAEAPVIAYVEPGVIVRLKQCREKWCRVCVKDHEGWIERSGTWGTYAHEERF